MEASVLRRSLLKRRSELQAEIDAATEARRQAERGSEVRDSKDDAALQQTQAGDDLQLARDLAELRDVEDALARLDAGSHGLCADCGVGIPAARLAAQPAARRCAACQTRLEAR